jgi:hypothetical protein
MNAGHRRSVYVARMGRELRKTPDIPTSAVKTIIDAAKVMRMRISLSATYMTSACAQTSDKSSVSLSEFKNK